MIDLSAQARALAEEVIVHCKGRKLVMVADVKAIVESALRSAVQEALRELQDEFKSKLDAAKQSRQREYEHDEYRIIHDGYDSIAVRFYEGQIAAYESALMKVIYGLTALRGAP